MGRDVIGKEIGRRITRMRLERIDNEWEIYLNKNTVKSKSKVILFYPYDYIYTISLILCVTPPNRVL